MISTTVRRRPIHPFPARMAPEVALEKVNLLTKAGETVLDPMCGSGTVLRVAIDQGRQAVGADLDPLAVQITRTTCLPLRSTRLEVRAQEAVAEAHRLGTKLPRWIAQDEETQEFINCWFARHQTVDLSRLARVLARRPARDDPLRIALSRLIITKDGGASLARDTAHSRPHRVRDSNSFSVLDEFVGSASKLEDRVTSMGNGKARSIRRADARSLSFLRSGSVDLAITSPPYLNAIDYLRGHRLSLVWLGWTMADLRALRGTAIGAERGISKPPPDLVDVGFQASPRFLDLSTRHQNMVIRFGRDIHQLCRSLGRVIRRQGHLVLVVADSRLQGVDLENSAVCRRAAETHGFVLVEQAVRSLPSRHRYLPPPSTNGGALAGRMIEEAILTFRRK